MPYAIACEICGDVIGGMVPLDENALRGVLAGTPFAALAAMIPANATDSLASLLRFRCFTHTKGIEHGNAERDGASERRGAQHQTPHSITEADARAGCGADDRR